MSGTVPDFVLYLPLALAVIGIIYGIFVALSIFKKSEGTAKMIKISGSIREGADAYLARQFRTIALFAVALAIIVYLALGPLVAIAFIVGAVCSGLVGYFGMYLPCAQTRAQRRHRLPPCRTRSPSPSQPAWCQARWYPASGCSASQ